MAQSKRSFNQARLERDLDDRIINLPIHQNLSAIDISKIVGVING